MRANEFIIEAVGGDYIYHSVAQPNQIWNILRKGVIQPHLSDTEIKQFLANGGQLEFLD